MTKYLAAFFAILLIVSTSFLGNNQKTENQPETLTKSGSNGTIDAPQEITSPPVPQKLTFAGEVVPLHQQEIKERLEREILSNTFFHSKTLQILKEANRWKTPIQNALKAEGVPTDFFYLAVAESALDNNAVSSAKAIGMWQFMASVAKDYGLQINTYVDERRNPDLATVAACAYLKDMKEQFGTWTNSAAAYNRGKTGLSNALKGQKVDSYYDLFLNRETYRYIFRILSYKVIMENPEAYGFNLNKDELYPQHEFTTVKVDTTINDLPAFAIKYKTTYKMLKWLNPWLDINARYMLYVPAGTAYEIKIPKP
ncbi:MAG: lytic transglycosylase domain-containing protein [Bacteroidia bacterium]